MATTDVGVSGTCPTVLDANTNRQKDAPMNLDEAMSEIRRSWRNEAPGMDRAALVVLSHEVGYAPFLTAGR